MAVRVYAFDGVRETTALLEAEPDRRRVRSVAATPLYLMKRAAPG
jgi:hypothetical protein